MLGNKFTMLLGCQSFSRHGKMARNSGYMDWSIIYMMDFSRIWELLSPKLFIYPRSLGSSNDYLIHLYLDNMWAAKNERDL